MFSEILIFWHFKSEFSSYVFFVIFTFLDHFSFYLKGFISFCSGNFDGFAGFWRNLKIQHGGPSWPPRKNDDIIPTSCDLNILIYGRQRKLFTTYFLPTKSHCDSFNALEVLNGGGVCLKEVRKKKNRPILKTMNSFHRTPHFFFQNNNHQRAYS